MQFSDQRTQKLVGKYLVQFKELVNAYLYESQARVDGLCKAYEGQKIKKPDLQDLVALAQDFAAAYQVLEEVTQQSSTTATTRLTKLG